MPAIFRLRDLSVGLLMTAMLACSLLPAAAQPTGSAGAAATTPPESAIMGSGPHGQAPVAEPQSIADAGFLTGRTQVLDAAADEVHVQGQFAVFTTPEPGRAVLLLAGVLFLLVFYRQAWVSFRRRH